MAAMLFYETPVALNRERHRHLKLAPATGKFPFAQRTNSVLLAATELADAATSYPVVFVGSGGGAYALAAIVGLSDQQNLFLDADGNWAPDAYIPAFVRRYPFGEQEPIIEWSRETPHEYEKAGLPSSSQWRDG